MKNKDYCTLFPEHWEGVYIGDCCKIHDEECHWKGFYNCLSSKLSKFSAVVITLGGSIGCLIRYGKA